MQLARSILLSAFATTIIASKISSQIFHGPPARADPTALMNCLDRLAADLVGNAWDDYDPKGWPCANSTFQIGALVGKISVHKVRETCHQELVRAAEKGEAWFRCDVRRDSRAIWNFGNAFVSWQPQGWITCGNKNGEPCLLDDGWFPERGDDGKGCRTAGLCPGPGEGSKSRTSTTTKSSSDAATSNSHVVVTVLTTSPSTSPQASITKSSNSKTTAKTKAFMPFAGLSTVSVTTAPSSTLSSPTRASFPASSAPDETLVIITMTSGQVPTSSALAKSTPVSYSKPHPTIIRTTRIDGHDYTYRASPTSTSIPVHPITTTISGQLYTFMPVTTKT